MTKVEEVKSEQENKSAVATNVTNDMITMPEELIKKEEMKYESEKPIKKEEVKYEQEEDMSRDMKMYHSMTSMPGKPVKKEEDQEDTKVSREYFEPYFGTYFEEYSRLERKQEDEKSKQEAEDLHHEELMQMDNTHTAPEEVSIPVDMVTNKRDNEEEHEQEEPGERDQLVESEKEEGVNQEVNTVEVHARATN